MYGCTSRISPSAFGLHSIYLNNYEKISVMISVDLWRNSYKADKESTRRKEYEQAFA